MKNIDGIKALAAGFLINMTFGVLYSWSIFAFNLTETLQWTKTQASLPYTTAIMLFALMMIPAGKLQAKYGGKIIASVGGILTGLGLILSSVFQSTLGMCISFGVFSGSGIGIGYAAVTPAVVKWFPENKKGVITGIVVSGFGLSTIYMAPLTNWMINRFGIFSAFRILGISLIILVVSLAQWFTQTESTVKTAESSPKEVPWQKMVRTKEFILLWIMFASGALGGLMIIGHLSKIVFLQLGKNLGFTLVALTAISNAGGRPVSGMLSDKIGRAKTMLLLSASQGLIFLIMNRFESFFALLFGAAVITFTYGSSFSVYPSAISDLFGKKNFGVNYGILFSAWGFGGVAGPILAGKMVDLNGDYRYAYMIAAALSISSAVIAMIYSKMEEKQRIDCQCIPGTESA
jgi:MFS family permease